MGRRVLSLLLILLVSCVPVERKTVHTGLDVLLAERMDLVHNRRIGIISNHTAVDGNGRHIVDLLTSRSDGTVTALFAPEHGIRGDRDEDIQNGCDSRTGLPVYSLYGQTRKPTPDMLRDVDVLIFDIQDIGARFYTYISTMALAMAAAAEAEIPFIVLDRPNPVTGVRVEGPVQEDSLLCFEGPAPIPVRHGMTTGELARMLNGEGWLEGGVCCELAVVPLTGWKRSDWFDDTGLIWMPTSPNMPDMETAAIYPGLCFLEATTVSEGRGTDEPFKVIGAPWIDGRKLSAYMNSQEIAGVRFSEIQFTPVSLPRRADEPKYKGKRCGGVGIAVTDRNRLRSVSLGIRLICAIRDLYPAAFGWRDGDADRARTLTGTGWIPEAIDRGDAPEDIIARWQADLQRFLTIRKKYLLYP